MIARGLIPMISLVPAGRLCAFYRAYFDIHDFPGLTEADIRLQLAEDDAKQASDGVPTPHHVTANAFIVGGLELEDMQ
jgi:hypothetical protein